MTRSGTVPSSCAEKSSTRAVPLPVRDRHQVLGGVDRVGGHQLPFLRRGGVGEVDRVVPTDHVAAGRLRHHLPAGPHLPRQRGDVVFGCPGELLHVPRMQPWCAAALGPFGDRAPDPVALVDLDQVLFDGGLHVLDEAGREDRHRTLVTGRLLGTRVRTARLLLEPGGEPFPCVGRENNGWRRSRPSSPSPGVPVTPAGR